MIAPPARMMSVPAQVQKTTSSDDRCYTRKTVSSFMGMDEVGGRDPKSVIYPKNGSWPNISVGIVE